MLFFPDKREILDPTIFNDDLALKIDWSPVSYSNRSTSGCTHKIQENDGNTLKLKTTTKGVFPFILCYIFSILFLLGTFIFWINIWFIVLPNVLIIYFIGDFSRKDAEGMEITMDKSLGRFQIRKKTYSISDIHAIQLLRFETRVRTSASGLPYMTHQINLIMNTRYGLDRVSFIEHSALKIIRKDSTELSNFLRVPIWDAMSYRPPSEDDLTHVKANLMFQQK